ncbi:MAG TPA: hypothetical protein VMJ32_15455 [Pirellulales bacterium]|nr:hypothetical protein [Pirellulales bacterium]
MNNLPAGYTLGYNYQGNKDIALVAVQEFAALVLAALAGLAWQCAVGEGR